MIIIEIIINNINPKNKINSKIKIQKIIIKKIEIIFY